MDYKNRGWWSMLNRCLYIHIILSRSLYVCMCISVVSIYSPHIPQTEQTSFGPLWEGLNHIHPESFESSLNKHDCWGPGEMDTTCAHNPILTMKSHLWNTNGLESGHFIPKHPTQLVDHQHHLHDGCCQRWRMNESMMNHHEASWMNHTSWWSSCWWLWIFMILVRHDLPDSTCTSLMNRCPMQPPNAELTQPEKRVDHTWSCCQQFYQLWWLIFFLRFYKIFHHGICYQYVTHWSSTPFKLYTVCLPFQCCKY